VVNLLEADPSRHYDVFHLRRVPESGVLIGVKRLDEYTPASPRQPRTHKSLRICNAQQPGLDTHTAGDQ
jgi:hypothetical protein